MDRRSLIIKLVFAGSFIVIALIIAIRADIIEENYQYSGVIQNITYSDKGTPEVIIRGEEYVVRFPNEDFKKKIRIGDSLIKIKKSRTYKLVKHDTKEVFLSE